MNEYNAVIEKLDMLSSMDFIDVLKHFGDPKNLAAWNMYASAVLSSNPECERWDLYDGDSKGHSLLNRTMLVDGKVHVRPYWEV